MNDPNRLYELLLDYAAIDSSVDDLMIGLVWTCCRSGSACGLAMSPVAPTRTLQWPGTLRGKPIRDLAVWIRDWEPHKAAVGMAAVNASLNRYAMPEGITLKSTIPGRGNLAVFDHFLPRLRGKKVVVIGRYPGLETLETEFELTVLERQPGQQDLPDPAAEYVLPRADWVFLTGSSIPNKTFPRLVELATDASTVLMGPTVPWLPQMHEFGIDYLAGVEISDPEALQATVAEGGGVRIFDGPVRYRIVALTPHTSMQWLRAQISAASAEKQALDLGMALWYDAGASKRFPDFPRLESANTRLSRLDTAFKTLWDRNRPAAALQADALTPRRQFKNDGQ